MPDSTEDTIIEVRPRRAEFQFGLAFDEGENGSPGLLERCREIFRSLGERVTSFDLSRQIYG